MGTRALRRALGALDGWPWAILWASAVAMAVAGWLWGQVIWPGAWRGPLFLALAPALLLGYLRCRRKIASRVQWTYLALALPAGLLLCLYMPTIASVSWDGQIHFDTAMAMATPGGATYDRADAIMCDADGIYDVGLHPWGTSEDDWSFNWEHLLSEKGTATADEKLADAAQEPYLRHSASGWRYDGVAIGGMGVLGRIPNALGLWLGGALGLPRLARYLLGRITGYLCWVAICLWAMGRVGSGKRLIMAIGLMPTMLFVAANYSYDPFSIGMIMVAAAGFAGELQHPDRKLTLASAAQILIPWFLGTAIKATFVAAGLFLVMMPRDKFRARWQWLVWELTGVAMVVALIVGFAAPFLSSQGSGTADDRGGEQDIRPWDQVQLILAEPVRYAGVLALWLLTYLSPVSLIQGLTVNFCYLPRPMLWPVLSVAELALIAWLTIFDRDRSCDGWATLRMRLTCLLGVLLAYLVSATSLYVAFTDYGATYILGMQVRYLLLELSVIGLIGLNWGTRPRRWLQRRLVARFHLLEGPARPGLVRLVRDGLSGQGMLWVEYVLVWSTLLLGFVVRF